MSTETMPPLAATKKTYDHAATAELASFAYHGHHKLNEDDTLAVVHSLIERGADPDAGGDYNNIGMLSHAADNNFLRLAAFMIASGADIDKTDCLHKHRPLHMAAKRGHSAMVDLLLQNNCTVDPPPVVEMLSYDPPTPLTLAITFNHTGVAEALLKAGANPLAKQGDMTPMQAVLEFGSDETAAIFLRYLKPHINDDPALFLRAVFSFASKNAPKQAEHALSLLQKSVKLQWADGAPTSPAAGLQ